MQLRALAIIAMLAPLLPAATADAEPAPDCSKAKTAVEKAICRTPALVVADAAMGKAYAELAKTLPPDQKAAALANQRIWVRDRDVACDPNHGDELTSCLLAQTEARRHFLAGEGNNRAADAPPLLPVFFNETKKGAYEISFAYPKFAGPIAPNFNAAASHLAADPDTVASFRNLDVPRAPGTRNFYRVSYETTYLDPRLAAVTFHFASYEGGAHPNSNRAALLWDLKPDAALTPSNVLTDPGKAVPALSAVCRDKFAVEAKAEGWDFFDNPDFAAVVKDAKSWAVDKDGATIMFDPYSIAAYVVGPRDCRLTYAELKDWLKPGGPLPPQ